MNGGEEESIRQIAALPYRTESGGSVQLLMVTSRETRRWIIPKGNRIRGLPPHKAAAREAYEEAGVLGVASPKVLGSYSYLKRQKDGRLQRASVDVFALAVDREADEWPEAAQRERRWFSVAEAVDALEEVELKALVASLSLTLPDNAGGRGSG